MERTTRDPEIKLKLAGKRGKTQIVFSLLLAMKGL